MSKVIPNVPNDNVTWTPCRKWTKSRDDVMMTSNSTKKVYSGKKQMLRQIFWAAKIVIFDQDGYDDPDFTRFWKEFSWSTLIFLDFRLEICLENSFDNFDDFWGARKKSYLIKNVLSSLKLGIIFPRHKKVHNFHTSTNLKIWIFVESGNFRKMDVLGKKRA